MNLTKYDGFEIHPCVLVIGEAMRLEPGDTFPRGDAGYEQCDEDHADLFCWSVYGHLIPDQPRNIGGLESLADCATEAEAVELAHLFECYRKQGEAQ